MNSTIEIVTKVEPSEVENLPKGCVVGDQFGGRSFNDNVAAALERRSYLGWNDYSEGDQTWTVIRIQR
jgi:hypothetical protein